MAFRDNCSKKEKQLDDKAKEVAELKTEEQRAVALLSYADAYHIYNNFDENHKQKGVCLANIGSVMMQMGDYKKARDYF